MTKNFCYVSIYNGRSDLAALSKSQSLLSSNYKPEVPHVSVMWRICYTPQQLMDT